MKPAARPRWGLAILALLAGSTLAFTARANPPGHTADPHATPAPAGPPPAGQPGSPIAPPPPPAIRPVSPAVPPPPVKPSAATPAARGAANDTPAAEPATPASAEDALKWLQEGNQRWMAGQDEAPNTSPARRQSVAAGQRPFATILTCADSRIPVERLFDRGVGDLFVLRVAGNTVGEHEAGSIEYAAEHLDVPLLVVLGHTRCGAVGAAASHGHAEGNIASLVRAIEPAVARAERLNPSLPADQIAVAAVRENVWQGIFDLLKSSQICRERVTSGELRIIGAVYDIADGRVEWLGEHPWQSELIAAFSPGAAPQQTAEIAPGAHATDAHDSH